MWVIESEYNLWSDIVENLKSERFFTFESWIWNKIKGQEVNMLLEYICDIFIFRQTYRRK